MITTKFQEEYTKLNPSQKRAVDSIEGPVMVIAGPGTGKTQILTLRIANILLNSQINPENILALTFTETGALAMRKRLVEMIGEAGFRVEINTFHGLCNQIIQKNPEDFTDLISSENITEVEQIELLEKILINSELNLLKPMGDVLYYVQLIMSAINDLKKEDILPEAFVKGLEKQKDDFERLSDLYHTTGKYKGEMKGKYKDLERQINKNFELGKLYTVYQQELVKKKLYDFNDMLIRVVSTLKKNKNLLQRLQEFYQYILVDEHQDTNTAQNELVQLLGSFYDNPNLFVVGDEKQSIYRFQGASLENFLYFKTLYPDALIVSLEENYRSTQSILDAGGSLISQNTTAKLLPTQNILRSQGIYSEEKIKVAKFLGYHSEYYFLAADLKLKASLGVSLSEIAILCRNNRDILQVIEVLEQQGIPYVIESEQNVLNDLNIRKLLILFAAISDLGSDEKTIKALHLDFLGLEPFDIYLLLKQAKILKKSIVELISSEEDILNIQFKSGSRLVWIGKCLSRWNRLSFNSRLEKVFKDIINESGFLNYILKQASYLQTLDKVNSLFEKIKLQTEKDPLFSLVDFLAYLQTLERYHLSISQSKTVFQNGVRVMTGHKSKGLEFDYVYIINAYDGHWSNLRKRTNGFQIPWDYLGVKIKDLNIDEVEDERRLFYVALTRARKGVVISFSESSLDGKSQIGSQFISEIGSNLIEYINTEEFEAEFLNKKEVLLLPDYDLEGDKIEDNNKNFLQSLFLQQGLSVTGLNNFLECPWRYFYRNLVVLPEEKSNSLLFGSAIHSAINSYIKALKISSSNVSFIVREFKRVLYHDMGETEDFNRFFERGEKSLTFFFDNEAINWTKRAMSELNIRGVKISDKVVLNGKIDMILPLKKNDVTVYDFKTGIPKTRNEIEGETKSADGNYKRQLVFYKILLDQYQQGRFNMTEGVISFIEPDQKGRYHKESFYITKEEVAALKDVILNVSEEIFNLSFWNKFCDDPQCEYCALRKVM